MSPEEARGAAKSSWLAVEAVITKSAILLKRGNHIQGEATQGPNSRMYGKNPLACARFLVTIYSNLQNSLSVYLTIG